VGGALGPRRVPGSGTRTFDNVLPMFHSSAAMFSLTRIYNNSRGYYRMNHAVVGEGLFFGLRLDYDVVVALYLKDETMNKLTNSSSMLGALCRMPLNGSSI
jgi:hypothetical protein